ncbi:MAG TPA: DMT family transporter [Devosia sp.]|nr:DMT family transporter [Devosia sp.]
MSRPYLILVLTNLFWAGNIVAGRLAVGHIDPFMLMVIRWTGAALLVLPFAIGRLRRNWPVIRRYWPLYLFYGAIGFGTYNMLTYVAAYHTSGVNIAMQQVTINIMVMALNFAIFRVTARPLQLVGAALTILGVALIITKGDLSHILSLTIQFGDTLVLLSCIIWAVYSLSLRYRPQTDWLTFVSVTMIGAAIASVFYLFTIGGGVSELPERVGAITWQGWLICAYTIIFPSILAQLFYVRGVELIGANRASLFINLLPLFGTIGSILVVGDSLQPFHLYAALAITIGIVLAETSARRGHIAVSKP